jgi:SEC-C motif-containing protein
MVDPSRFFQHGRVPCKNCGQINDFGSSEALYYADLSTPCAHCGFRFLEHSDRQMQKLMEMADKVPEWRELLRKGRTDVIKRRLDELVPLPEDKSKARGNVPCPCGSGKKFKNCCMRK